MGFIQDIICGKLKDEKKKKYVFIHYISVYLFHILDCLRFYESEEFPNCKNTIFK